MTQINRIKKSDLADLAKLQIKINAAKEKAASARDELRDLMDEVESIVSSFDNGIEELESAERNIKDAISSMSEYV